MNVKRYSPPLPHLPSYDLGLDVAQHSHDLNFEPNPEMMMKVNIEFGGVLIAFRLAIQSKSSTDVFFIIIFIIIRNHNHDSGSLAFFGVQIGGRVVVTLKIIDDDLMQRLFGGSRFVIARFARRF
jgi:hypothetical protein